MSIWVRAVCRKTVSAVTTEQLESGIARRLELISYLYGEDDYEEALAAIRVEAVEDRAGVYRIHYGPRRNQFIRCDRWTRPKIDSELKELEQDLEARSGAELDSIRNLLAEAVEVVGFELKQSDADGMGWPVAISAAAHFAEVGEGAIHADGEGWMEPTADEVRSLVDE